MAYTYAQGNPVLFWAFPPSAGLTMRRLWRRDSASLVVLVIGFFGQWVPWALVPRDAFLYHFLPSVPWGCLAVALLVAQGWERGGVWRWIAGGYVMAVVGVFGYFYPIWALLPLSREQFEARLWLESWR